MALPSTLFCLLLSVSLVYGHLLTDDRTTRRPRKGDPKEERKSQTRIQSRQQRSVNSQDNPECQEGNPPGVSYLGRVNVTASGTTCQAWAATQSHQHNFTDVGEHNYCRNPNGDLEGVWCYITDPDKQWEHCSVPICGRPTMLNVLDFSADNDQEPDRNGEYTSATLAADLALPESFTICLAFMVEAWTTEFSGARMFILLDDDGYSWGYIHLFAVDSYTQYRVKLGPVFFVRQVEAVYFPLQWAHVCLSLEQAN